MECKICDYITDDDRNSRRHLRSKSHLKNKIKLEEKLKLRKDNQIEKQKKICEDIVSQIEEREKILFAEVNNKLQNIEDRGKKTDLKMKKLDGKISAIKKGVEKITDSVDFLTECCSNASPIIKLTDKEIYKMLKINDNNKNNSADCLMWKMRVGQLHAYIGDIIATYYTENNPIDQGLWSSDTARLTYVIMQLATDNKKHWVRDKKAELFVELIAGPIIAVLQKLFKEYVRSQSAKYNDEIPEELLESHVKNIQCTNEIHCPSVIYTLSRNITKHVAKKVCLNKKRDMIIYKNDITIDSSSESKKSDEE